MAKTTITGPNGEKTTIRRSGGCGSAFVWALAIFLVLGAIVSAPVLLPVTIFVVLAFAALAAYIKSKENK